MKDRIDVSLTPLVLVVDLVVVFCLQWRGNPVNATSPNICEERTAYRNLNLRTRPHDLFRPAENGWVAPNLEG